MMPQRLASLGPVGVRRFWHDFLRRHRAAFVRVGGLMVLSVLLQLAAPILTMLIVDSATAGGATLDRIGQLSVLFIGLVFLRGVFSFVGERATLHLKESIILDLEVRLVRHLHALPLGFFSSHHSTYLQARAMNDARAVEGALVRSLVTLLVNGLTLLVGLAFVLYIRAELALLLALFIVPFGLVRHYTNEKMRVLSREMQERQSAASAAVAESLAGVRTVKAFVREDLQESVLARPLAALRDIYVRTNWFGIVDTVGTGLITSLSIAFVLWYGMRGVVLGSMTLGEVVAVLAFLNFLYVPINSLVAANFSLQQAISAIQRIYELLAEVPERTAGRPLGRVVGRIELAGVSFRYPGGGGPDVLSHLDLVIEPGSTVALVGRSGAGKSTLVNLLVRFYETDRGLVLLDGADVREVALASLREAIGVVDQQTFLFGGTVLDNLRFGRPEASREEVVAASRRAFAHEFVERLPEGYDTLLGERGARLSSGECQRLALARMFLKDPPVLVLDEAVSNIDSESERAIRSALGPLTENRTTILVAHRLSSLLLAREVVVLDRGRVAERGSHAALIAAGGLYTTIFREQFQPQFEPERRAPERAAVVA